MKHPIIRRRVLYPTELLRQAGFPARKRTLRKADNTYNILQKSGNVNEHSAKRGRGEGGKRDFEKSLKSERTSA